MTDTGRRQVMFVNLDTWETLEISLLPGETVADMKRQNSSVLARNTRPTDNY